MVSFPAKLQLAFPWGTPREVTPPRKPTRARRTRRLVRVRGRQREWWFSRGGVRKGAAGPRARTLNVERMERERRRTQPDLFDLELVAILRALPDLRPKTRAACPTEGPCPWVGCRYHRALSVDPENGSIKETFPDLHILEDPVPDDPSMGLPALEARVGCCTLDDCDDIDGHTGGVAGLMALYQAAETGRPPGQTPGATMEEVGVAMNLTVERVRQLSAATMQEVRVKLRILTE